MHRQNSYYDNTIGLPYRKWTKNNLMDTKEEQRYVKQLNDYLDRYQKQTKTVKFKYLDLLVVQTILFFKYLGCMHLSMNLHLLKKKKNKN